MDTIRYGHEFRWTQIRERLRWRGPAATVNYRPILSSGRVPHKEIETQLSKENFHEKKRKIWLRAPDGGLILGETSRLTVGHNITFTLILT
jgi:hypothetical protein